MMKAIILLLLGFTLCMSTQAEHKRYSEGKKYKAEIRTELVNTLDLVVQRTVTVI